MRRTLDIAGQSFGRLTAQRRVGADRNGHSQWECRCECGTLVVVVLGYLRRGETTSCGCLRPRRDGRPRGKTHSMSRSPTYRSWSNMLQRCFRQQHKSFADYGGRGITVCEPWLDEHGFENFLADMGTRPEGMTLDRIDPNGDYTPDNCRWATAQQQHGNKRLSAARVSSLIDDIAGRDPGLAQELRVALGVK